MIMMKMKMIIIHPQVQVQQILFLTEYQEFENNNKHRLQLLLVKSNQKTMKPKL